MVREVKMHAATTEPTLALSCIWKINSEGRQSSAVIGRYMVLVEKVKPF